MSTETISPIERATMRKVGWRLIPFLMLCYLFAMIDRANIGMASLQMNEDLGLTKAAFGFASSLYFITYFIFEIPSNLALERFGARRWIARIMITWGLISGGTAFVQGATSLYVMRLLLGAAEAGFFPGVILYLTYWLPKAYRARLIATFMVAIPAASFIGSPISGALLELDGLFGMRGWHWVFIMEAVPTILLGVICLLFLTDKPAQARWLSDEQRDWLVSTIQRENSEKKKIEGASIGSLLRNPYIWAMALVCSGASAAGSTLSVWQPQLLKSFGGLSNFEVGLISAIPYGVSCIAMVLWGRHSDRTDERRWHTAIPLSLMAVGLLATFTTGALAPTVLMLTAVLVGAYSFKGPFWALSYSWLSPATAATGLAAIGATANLIGGGLMVNVYGWIRQATDSYALALLPLALLNLSGCLLVLFISRNQAHHPDASTLR